MRNISWFFQRSYSIHSRMAVLGCLGWKAPHPDISCRVRWERGMDSAGGRSAERFLRKVGCGIVVEPCKMRSPAFLPQTDCEEDFEGAPHLGQLPLVETSWVPQTQPTLFAERLLDFLETYRNLSLLIQSSSWAPLPLRISVSRVGVCYNLHSKHGTACTIDQLISHYGSNQEALKRCGQTPEELLLRNLI